MFIKQQSDCDESSLYVRLHTPYGVVEIFAATEFAEDGSLVGASRPITVNGRYFLSWHIAAALGNNGFGNSWLQKQSDEDVWRVLSNLSSLPFSKQLKMANTLAGTYVY